MNKIFYGLILSITMIISGCGGGEPVDVVQRAVNIESADECHVCGMIINNFPGPKGQLYMRRDAQVKKFCSTRDLFSYLLEPENAHRVSSVFVHDMAVSPWESPINDSFIDGRAAFYVVDHTQQGAMGPTLASFKQRTDAEQFSRKFGGRVIGFDEITMKLLVELM